MDKILVDRIQGIIYGQAVGDALGLGTEFLSKDQVLEYYGSDGLRHYDQIIRDRHRRRWAIGDWTDDTDQMLCILDSLLESNKLDILDIASRLYKWATGGGMGIGRTVKSVLRSPNFLRDPHSAAKKVWDNSGHRVASNGGVMRTSVLGIWEYQSHEKVRHNAEQVCKITHYDPRCVGSCVAVCLAISLLLRGVSDVGALIQEVASEVTSYDSRIQEYFDKATQETLEALDLDEGLSLGEANRIGYTLKTMGAGFWALKNAPSYVEGILQVIHEGGDADSNAAVAGSLLGARFGISNIPQSWVNGLAYESQLHSRVERLIRLVGTADINN